MIHWGLLPPVWLSCLHLEKSKIFLMEKFLTTRNLFQKKFLLWETVFQWCLKNSDSWLFQKILWKSKSQVLKMQFFQKMASRTNTFYLFSYLNNSSPESLVRDFFVHKNHLRKSDSNYAKFHVKRIVAKFCFYFSWNHHKIYYFLMISSGIKVS